MQDWLETEKIKEEVPDDVLEHYLPTTSASGACMHDWIIWPWRRNARWTVCARRSKEPRRAIDVFVALFGRNIDETNRRVVEPHLRESGACLNFLLHRGEITTSGRPRGVILS